MRKIFADNALIKKFFFVFKLVECMFEMRARAGQWVIQEGEPGDRLFVVAEGELQVSREGQALGKIGQGVVMGELAILYNCTRFVWKGIGGGIEKEESVFLKKVERFWGFRVLKNFFLVFSRRASSSKKLF